MLVRTAIEIEASGYEAALSAAHLEVTQMGVGAWPSAVRDVTYDHLHLTSGRVGFPVVGRTTFGDETLAVALIVRPAPGSRWSGNDLRPGMLLTYGPGAEHHAVSNPGLEYRYVLVDRDMLLARADALRCRIRVPARGDVLLLSAAPKTSDIRGVLRQVGGPFSDDLALADGEDEVLEALVSAFAADRPEAGPRPRTTINNRRLVNACIDFADEIGRIPRLSELCEAFSVSERRLREAFHDSCGTGPNAFLRARQLGMARRRLLAPDAPTVTAVSNDLGFHHPSRFARQYARLFGELPHETAPAVDADPAPYVHISVGHDEPAANHVA